MNWIKWLVVMAGVALTTACMAPGLALVREGAPEDYRDWYANSEIGTDSVAPTDRLVLLRITYSNPLSFRNELSLVHEGKSDGEGGGWTPLFLNASNGDTLLLIRFVGSGSDSAYLEPRPCNSSSTQCYGSFGGALRIKLPPAGKAVYAGQLRLKIVDQFPDRGTQNLPVIAQFTLHDAAAEDIPAAVKKWPFLKNRPVPTGLAILGATPGYRPLL